MKDYRHKGGWVRFFFFFWRIWMGKIGRGFLKKKQEKEKKKLDLGF